MNGTNDGKTDRTILTDRIKELEAGIKALRDGTDKMNIKYYFATTTMRGSRGHD